MFYDDTKPPSSGHLVKEAKNNNCLEWSATCFLRFFSFFLLHFPPPRAERKVNCSRLEDCTVVVVTGHIHSTLAIHVFCLICAVSHWSYSSLPNTHTLTDLIAIPLEQHGQGPVSNSMKSLRSFDHILISVTDLGPFRDGELLPSNITSHFALSSALIGKE